MVPQKSLHHRLNNEELQLIKYDPEEFNKLGVCSKSLESFVVLDGSGANSHFYEPVFLNSVRYILPKSYKYYHSNARYIGYGQIQLQFGIESVTNIYKLPLILAKNIMWYPYKVYRKLVILLICKINF